MDDGLRMTCPHGNSRMHTLNSGAEQSGMHLLRPHAAIATTQSDGNLSVHRLIDQKATTDCWPKDEGKKMTHNKTVAVLTLSALLAGALAPIATAKGMDDRGPMQMLNFVEIDADKDGKITTEEFAAFRTAEFAKTDTNADGQISAEELSAKHVADATARAADMSAKMIERMDENADGQISPEEMERGPRPASMFERADADGDGALTMVEVEDAMAKMRGKHGRHGKGNN